MAQCYAWDWIADPWLSRFHRRLWPQKTPKTNRWIQWMAEMKRKLQWSVAWNFSTVCHLLIHAIETSKHEQNVHVHYGNSTNQSWHISADGFIRQVGKGSSHIDISLEMFVLRLITHMQQRLNNSLFKFQSSLINLKKSSLNLISFFEKNESLFTGAPKEFFFLSSVVIASRLTWPKNWITVALAPMIWPVAFLSIPPKYWVKFFLKRNTLLFCHSLLTASIIACGEISESFGPFL